ncbi:MAG: hypothetical protein IJA02_02560 [Clostridia bacterium]|nr:hypothetical protein [Clostridia bacterium]
MPKSNNKQKSDNANNITRFNVKGFLKLGVFLAFFVLMVWIILKIAVVPKEPVTSEQFYNILVEQGFEPQDITEEYYKFDEDYRSVLIKCLATEKEDIKLVFFEFNNENSPKEIYQQALADIKTKYNAIYKVETDHQVANHSIYTLDSLGKYNIAIYVGNTAISGYCNSENKNEINKILDAIDYLKPGNSKETTE